VGCLAVWLMENSKADGRSRHTPECLPEATVSGYRYGRSWAIASGRRGFEESTVKDAAERREGHMKRNVHVHVRLPRTPSPISPSLPSQTENLAHFSTSADLTLCVPQK
jgi:hypothetical protein